MKQPVIDITLMLHAQEIQFQLVIISIFERLLGTARGAYIQMNKLGQNVKIIKKVMF